MANHIATADIKHRNIKRFGATELADYVTLANQRFDDYAVSIGVSLADIPADLPSSVKSFILADMYMEIARDNVGSEGSMLTGEANLYQSIYALYNDQYIKLKPRMTPNMVTGGAVSLTTSAASFGRLERG